MSSAPPALSRRARPAASRRARRAAAGLLVAIALGVGAAACSTATPSRDDLVDALVTSGLSKAESACAADAVVDNLTDDELAEIVERGGSGAPRDDPKDADDTMDKLRTALNVCRDQAAATSTTVPAPSTTTSTTIPAASTTTP